MADLAGLERKIVLLQREFSGEEGRRRLGVIGRETKKDITEAVQSDLGDESMSGWRRKKPVQIRGRYDIVSDHELRIYPNAAGPMVVLEIGRNHGKARPTPQFNKRGKQTKRSKWNGRTTGKRTWSDAEKLIEQRVPGRVDRQVAKAIGRYFS
jgi:hypothetical protein